MIRTTIHRTVAVLAAAALTTTLVSTALASEADPAKTDSRVVKCDGKVATKVGTAGRDIIYGTRKRDIIHGLGGNDTILGRGGHDIICGGTGNDRLVGNAGVDRIIGGLGRDVLVGGVGADRMFGGPHDDRFNGGPGTDLCQQGSGSGPKANCELPPAPVQPAPQSGPKLLPLDGILAIAYSDIDGLNGYSTGDKLIAKLVDLDGDKVGDSVVMGRYPTDLSATAFADWLDPGHAVVSQDKPIDQIDVTSRGGAVHHWHRSTHGEYYEEALGADNSLFLDSHSPTFHDAIGVEIGSPGVPRVAVPHKSEDRISDDAFIDVELPS